VIFGISERRGSFQRVNLSIVEVNSMSHIGLYFLCYEKQNLASGPSRLGVCLQVSVEDKCRSTAWSNTFHTTGLVLDEA
jgi:hypothetical protein